MRINKFLARVGVASRRQSEELILQGKVTINGQVIKELGTQVVEGDHVEFEGQTLELPENIRVLILHKPKQVICSQNDPQGRNIVYDLLPQPFKNLHYVGRLDYESRGLLLLTNNGELSRRLTLPSYQIPRFYSVTLNRPLAEDDQIEIERGLILADGTSFRPAKVKVLDKKVEMRLTEGKKREIREMMKALGYRVNDLFRTAYANISIDALEEGQWREVTAEELNEILRSVEMDSTL